MPLKPSTGQETWFGTDLQPLETRALQSLRNTQNLRCHTNLRRGFRFAWNGILHLSSHLLQLHTTWKSETRLYTDMCVHTNQLNPEQFWSSLDHRKAFLVITLKATIKSDYYLILQLNFLFVFKRKSQQWSLLTNTKHRINTWLPRMKWHRTNAFAVHLFRKAILTHSLQSSWTFCQSSQQFSHSILKSGGRLTLMFSKATLLFLSKQNQQ